MTKEKQINEMAKSLAKIQCNKKGCEDCEFHQFECDDLQHYTKIAELLTAEGYRKASDVAREIIDILKSTGIDRYRYPVIAEIEKKYIGEDTNVRTNTEGEG